MKNARPIILGTISVLLLGGLALEFRHRILFAAISTGAPPPLLPTSEEGPAVRWYDDYFTIEQLDAQTWAIGEPRYEQQVLNYLIVGRERALLFDAGTGLRDIRPVVASLTDLPLTFMPSHLHYDHIGNEVTFERVALVDLPHLRARAPENRLALTWAEHLGTAEGYDTPTLEIDEWIAPGETIALGGRSLRVLHTPGHTTDSVSLFDEASGLLFSGDFLYEGPLFAFLPNSSLKDYLRAAGAVTDTLPANVRIFGAHRASPPGTPRLSIADLRDLREQLRSIRAGTLAGKGAYPVVYPINERLDLGAPPAFLQDWSD